MSEIPNPGPSQPTEYKLAVGLDETCPTNCWNSLWAKVPAMHREKFWRILSEFEFGFRQHGHKFVFKDENDTLDLNYELSMITKQQDIYQWIEERSRDLRGSELPGMISTQMARKLFLELVKCWEKMVTQLYQKVEAYIQANTGIQPGAETLDVSLMSLAKHNESATRRKLLVALQEVHDLADPPMVNGYVQKLNILRSARLVHRFKSVEAYMGAHCGSSIEGAVKATAISSEDFGVRELHDILKAWYEVALQHCVDKAKEAVWEDFRTAFALSTVEYSP